MDVWRCVLAGLTTLLMSCGDHETVTMDTSAPLEEDYPVSAAENPKPIWDGERTEVFQDAALAHLKEVIKHLEAGKADPAIDQAVVAGDRASPESRVLSIPHSVY